MKIIFDKKIQKFTKKLDEESKAKILVVLHAIFKKSQKIPKKDIDLALKRANKHLT